MSPRSQVAKSPYAGLERPPGFVYRTSKSISPGSDYVLHCENLPLPRMAGRFGTPLYVYSASTIRARLSAFERAFRGFPHTICYSVKANSNISILRLLAREECGFDVVSGGELERVLAANRSAAKKTVFSGVGKTRDEITSALKAGILIFNVESESELLVLAECAARIQKKARVAWRVNPDVAANTHPYIATGLHKHKFGIPIDHARALYAKAAAAKYLRVAGVSVHIGSQITDPAPFGEAMVRIADLVKTLRSDGHMIDYVDSGGGLGISYQEAESDLKTYLENYAHAVTQPLRTLNIQLLLEPGRSIVGPAGVLLTSVVYRKQNDGKRFLIVDAAMNDMIRPSLYGAYHEIVPVKQSEPQKMNAGSVKRETLDIVGPICESGDFFARDRELPEVKEGDLLAILDAGAYGMALASNYNTRTRPAEVLVTGNAAKIIRRREKISDLYSTEL
jgi:diaminopimelate decarboxylase